MILESWTAESPSGIEARVVQRTDTDQWASDVLFLSLSHDHDVDFPFNVEDIDAMIDVLQKVRSNVEVVPDE